MQYVVIDFLVGCGTSPLAPPETAEGPIRLSKRTVNTATATRQDADLIDATVAGIDAYVVYENTTSARIGPRNGGSLLVSFPRYGNESTVHVVSAEFIVPKRALESRKTISMTVTTGYTLDDVTVTFGPSGLVFTQAAKLVIKLKGGDPEAVEAFHFSQDQVSAADIRRIVYDDGRAGWRIVLNIPGFSRYSLGGDS
ncbi:MAG: hypothetical protein HOE48_05365 [Candidatus Latescibacteria bacterium]|nr:hypothetical protein [Candidatus Latescibacterota bacterium]MBT4137321.1 hypothetical protein [Candidatus Latescibacterota bacterium]MBT5830791.1 hypothetical protein [Candidatus Latescibacterota bacterium]